MEQAQAQEAYGRIPQVHAILLCDRVYTDRGTNKKILAGVFGNLTVANFPARHTMSLYARLSNAQGRYVFRIECAHVDSDRVLGGVASKPLEIQDPTRTFDFDLPIGVEIDVPGLYEFRLYANEAFIGLISFTVTHVSAEGN